MGVRGALVVFRVEVPASVAVGTSASKIFGYGIVVPSRNVELVEKVRRGIKNQLSAA